ncbi:beta-ketoacyl synthase N-terminal-like domain-containing protein [Streptomyces sp. NPDC048172]|uniref:beta-ketoacyl synthase N-terminal-like domain-containing protein n=1 Tax=Streptomyces sp. NPDC048172 TaxID=3365505 RepID=UPI0037202D0E
MTRRSVITGVGALAPTGIGAAPVWKAAREGVTALGPLARYPALAAGGDRHPLALAGEIPGFDPHAHLEGGIVAQTDRFTHLALAASDMALREAALVPAELPPYAVGVVTASCAGGVEFGQREIQRLWSQGPTHVGPYQSIAWFYAASTGQISLRHGLKGPSGVVVTDEAGGLDAVAYADREIRRGTAAMLAGGAEAPLSPFSMACQFGHGMLSTASEPAHAYLPFTNGARGFVPAEGGAVFLVEERTAALERGAEPLARVAGHGTTFTGPADHPASAAGLETAARQAFAEAGLGPGDIDVVFADALGVPEADAAEADALRALFGPRLPRIPVTAPKTGTGRAYSGAAALDAAHAVRTLRHGDVPPTPYVTAPGPGFEDLDLVTGRARTTRPRTALLLARGLSGNNSALILTRHTTEGGH